MAAITTTGTTQSTSVHLSVIMGNPAPVTEDSTAVTMKPHSAIESADILSKTAAEVSALPHNKFSQAEAHSEPIVPVTSTTSMSGLLNSRNLDEKLVVATLATLDSGTASSLIKQDLKWIIQSRRKAEGKAELQVEFKKPVKEEQLTSEEVIKRSRRRELNRLAARRSREKGQRRKELLVEEIRKLQSQNTELVEALGSLTEQRNHIIHTLRQHMKQCSDYEATQKASVGLSNRVLEMLGFPTDPDAEPSSLHVAGKSTVATSSTSDVPGMSSLYISTSDLTGTDTQKQSMQMKTETWSCPPSPHVLDLGKGSASLSACSANDATLLTSIISATETLPAAQSIPDASVSSLNIDEESQLQVFLDRSSPASPATKMNLPVFLMTSNTNESPPQILKVAGLTDAADAETTAVPNVGKIKLTATEVLAQTSSNPSLISRTIPLFHPVIPTVMPAGIHSRRRSSTASLSGVTDSVASLKSSQSAPSDSGLGSSQEDTADVGKDDEMDIIPYRHKLMKHRKQHSSDFTRPPSLSTAGINVGLSTGGSGGGRKAILLERSFSFPSSRCEQLRSVSVDTSESKQFEAHLGFSDSSMCMSPGSVSSSPVFLSHSSGTIISHHKDSILTADGSKSSLDDATLSSSLEPSALQPQGSSKSIISSSISNLINKASSETPLSNPRRHYSEQGAVSTPEEMATDEDNTTRSGWRSPMDTWPPAGSPRSSRAFSLSGMERRWSVDDYHAAPLNLSRHSSVEEMESRTEPESGSQGRSEQFYRDSFS